MGKDKDSGSDNDKPTDGGRHDVNRDGETGKKPQEIDPKRFGPDEDKK